MSAAMRAIFVSADAPARQRRAEQISQALAPWQAHSEASWRLHLQVPPSVGPGDLLCLRAAPAKADVANWLAAGAVVLASVRASDGKVCDTLHTAERAYRLEGTHDDDFEPALAAFLDAGFAPHDALCLARAWRGDGSHAGAQSDAFGAWPVRLACFPRVLDLQPTPGPFAPAPRALGLYPVVPDADWIERLAALDVATLQLRAKTGEPAYLNAQIQRAVAAGRAHGTRLFINDHWRLALAAGAYGVHLGQEDFQRLDAAELAELQRSGVRLGISTHGYYEMLVAWHFSPSYIAMGAVFPTTTKVMPTAPQGLAKLARYARLMAPHVPLVAIGGVNEENLDQVLATGVGSAAVVRAVTEAGDLAAAVTELQAHFRARS